VSMKDELAALYAEVPDAHCKGLCVDSCGPIAATAGEAGRMFKEASGRPLLLAEDLRCGYLDRRGRCAVYEVRPLICRLYGSVDDPRMRCPYGCEPERYLSNAEATALMARAIQIGGPPVYTVEPDIEDALVTIYGTKMAGH